MEEGGQQLGTLLLFECYKIDRILHPALYIKAQVFRDTIRETREGWPMLTFETR
jgi:hypothetical protein